MKPWELLGEAHTPDGTRVTLTRRDGEFLILADGLSLMPSSMHGSEDALARLACERMPAADRPSVLVGGLGMGYTLRAALNVLPATATVLVSELLSAVVAWNRGPLGPLAAHPLDDPRVSVETEDVVVTLRAHPRRFHAVMLDVDNGPAAFSSAHNHALYGPGGIATVRAALVPGGMLAVWAIREDTRFVQRLLTQGFQVEVIRARGHAGKGVRHIVFLARAPDSRRPPQAPDLSGAR